MGSASPRLTGVPWRSASRSTYICLHAAAPGTAALRANALILSCWLRRKLRHRLHSAPWRARCTRVFSFCFHHLHACPLLYRLQLPVAGCGWFAGTTVRVAYPIASGRERGPLTTTLILRYALFQRKPWLYHLHSLCSSNSINQRFGWCALISEWNCVLTLAIVLC